MPYMTNGKRDYKREYAKYAGKPSQIKKRSERNQARAIVKKRDGAAAIAGKDIDHSKPLSKGGTNSPSNLVAISINANRSFKRDSKSKLVSQKSKREAKKK